MNLHEQIAALAQIDSDQPDEYTAPEELETVLGDPRRSTQLAYQRAFHWDD